MEENKNVDLFLDCISINKRQKVKHKTRRIISVFIKAKAINVLQLISDFYFILCHFIYPFTFI